MLTRYGGFGSSLPSSTKTKKKRCKSWTLLWQTFLDPRMRATEVRTRLHGCAGSSEPLLLAYAISTKSHERSQIYMCTEQKF